MPFTLARVHRNLGEIAGFAHRSADHDRAVVDFRHFLFEELDEQRRIRARENDLRPLRAPIDAANDRADTVADGVVFGARLFLARQLGLHASELDDDVAVLEPLHGPAHDLADPLAVFPVNVLALGFTDLLEDDLLRGLRRDAAEILGRARKLDFHVDFRFVAVELLRLGQRNLRCRVRDLLDDLLYGIELELPAVGIEARAQRLALVALARGRFERVLHGADDDFRFDALLFRDGVDLLEQRVGRGHYLSLIRFGLPARGGSPRTQLPAGRA